MNIKHSLSSRIGLVLIFRIFKCILFVVRKMKKTAFCVLTKKEYPIKDLVSADSIRYQIKSLIQHDYPALLPCRLR